MLGRLRTPICRGKMKKIFTFTISVILCGALSGSTISATLRESIPAAGSINDFSVNYSISQPVVEDIARGNLPGFVGQIPDQENLAIDLYIYGQPSQEVDAYIQANRQVNIVVRAAKHSLADLQRGADVLGSMVKNSEITGGVKLKSFQIESNGSGISIGYDGAGISPSQDWIKDLESKLGVTVLAFRDSENIRELGSSTELVADLPASQNKLQ